MEIVDNGVYVNVGQASVRMSLEALPSVRSVI